MIKTLMKFTDISKIHTSLLQMKNLTDFTQVFIFVLIFQLLIYLISGFYFEYTNPTPKTPKRIQQIKKEIMYSGGIMIINVGYAIFWLYAVDHLTPFYGYFETHKYTITHFIIGLFVYLFVMDTWFYWTHRFLHMPYFFKNVHLMHHQFYKPSAFCQDAVHPLEGLIQGPVGHGLATLFYPIHPIALAVFGTLTSIFAIAAHDGREYDINDHYKHHTHVKVNFSLYWGFWDVVCGTRWNPKLEPDEGYKNYQD
jgi:Delta7-sterol 5-desaturase